jgi:hypothetical protein
MGSSSRSELLSLFPGLTTGFQRTSDHCPRYNCIAWAAGETNAYWWPNQFGYWPQRLTRRTTLEAFIELFRSLGYEECELGDLEDGTEKISIYAIGTEVTHAARQLSNGQWTSKLGDLDDIMHRMVEAVEGAEYGKCVQFMKRRRRA